MLFKAIEFKAPEYKDGAYHLAAEFDAMSGDVVEIKAILTPETIAKAQQYGDVTRTRLMRWMNDRVKLTGDWSQFGMAGKMAAGVVRKAAANPMMNLPPLGEEGDKSHPSYTYAKDVLKDYATFCKLRAANYHHHCRKDWKELMAGCLHYGNCCCGKKRVMATYDGGWLLGSFGDPCQAVIDAVTDQMALRSYRAMFG